LIYSCNNNYRSLPIFKMHGKMIISKVAAIDIGSNAVRLLISRVKRNPEGIELKKELLLRIPLRLGEDSFTLGEISEKRVEKLINVVNSFRHLMNVYQVDIYRAYATSAMRDAKNNEEIIRLIKEKTKIDLKVITGAQEAKIIFESHAADSLQLDKNYLYVDVGGGSTEISLIIKGALADFKSFNIGTIRMLRGKVAYKEMEEMKSYLIGLKNDFAPVEIIGSGGNINKLFKLSKTPKTQALTIEKLQVIYKLLTQLTLEERMATFDLKPDRADVIIPACEIFLQIAEISNISEIYVPTIGLVDGIVHSIMEEVNQKNAKKTNKQSEKMQ
jgi:exopolyphosphatase / guanosine-5'-triphosphate,3'-diphosphate pyrophosphatase